MIIHSDRHRLQGILGPPAQHTDDSRMDLRYNITMQSALYRRLTRLEAQRPKRVSGPMVSFSCLSPEVQAMWLAADGDLNQMNLAELDVLAADLRRFTE